LNEANKLVNGSTDTKAKFAYTLKVKQVVTPMPPKNTHDMVHCDAFDTGQLTAMWATVSPRMPNGTSIMITALS
jgi:hypothetical protein